MVTQMRLDTNAEGRMEEWVQGWLQGVHPLRIRKGFEIPGAWVLEGTNRFLWLLRYEGREGFEGANAAYYASEDRKSLDPDPAKLIAKAETCLLRSVLPG